MRTTPTSTRMTTCTTRAWVWSTAGWWLSSSGPTTQVHIATVLKADSVWCWAAGDQWDHSLDLTQPTPLMWALHNSQTISGQSLNTFSDLCSYPLLLSLSLPLLFHSLDAASHH